MTTRHGEQSCDGIGDHDIDMIGHDREVMYLARPGLQHIREWDAPHWAMYQRDVGAYCADLNYYSTAVDFIKPRTLLDLGCGAGRISLHVLKSCLAPDCLIGVDASPLALTQFRAQASELGLAPRVITIAATFERLPVGMSDVDMVIFGFDNVGYVTEAGTLSECLRECRRVLAKNGRMIIDFREPRPLFAYIDEPICAIRTILESPREIWGVAFEFTRSVCCRYVVAKRYALEVVETHETFMTAPTLQRFWTRSEIAGSLRRAGFVIEHTSINYEVGTLLGDRWPWIQIVARNE